jgi:signal transduction histidine kinase/CheY-like chemotaxis protein
MRPPGAMELQMRAHPWEATPAGPVRDWPTGLKTAVRLLLDCRMPMHLLWGRDCTQFFNDACLAVLGDRGGAALGAAVGAMGPGALPIAGALLERVWDGASLHERDMAVVVQRNGVAEPCHFSLSCSPVYGDDGRVGGILTACVDTTGKVRAERRQAFQMALADLLYGCTDGAAGAGPLLVAVVQHVGAWLSDATVTFAEVDRTDGAAIVRAQWRDGANVAEPAVLPLDALCCGSADTVAAGRTVCKTAGAGDDADAGGIVVPLMENGRLQAVLALHGSRRWDSDDVSVLEDAARRTSEALRRIRAEDALREETRALELMKGASETLAAITDLEPLMQTITDTATQLIGAQFGAFFYNARDDNGDAYQLYTLAGAPRDAFARFGKPRATALFGPTFHGSGPVRSDDIALDARYGTMAPHHGMPAGHLPVRSYLAASVVSRSGDVIGGLFFGHGQPAMFSARSEELIAAFAVQAAIAIDNAALHDMTQRAAAERDQLLASERAARAEAERHNKMKDEFLAMLAHELRNPLAPITSAAQLLRLPEVNESLRLKASHIISRQVRHMTALVDDLLDVSRVTRGLVKLDTEILDLNKIAMAAIEQARPHIEERLHTLTVELPNAPVPVEGDRTRLVQVLVNLLNNAAKYTPQGGSIQLAVGSDGVAAEACVRDNGSGIDAQLLPYVFDLFTQADRAPDRSQGGLGIGLALVKSIVRMHDGQVAAHSPGPQCGTTMTVTLPLAHAEVGQIVRSGEGTGAAPHPLVVTVVDDNADAGQSLAVLLRAHGHTVHVYEDGGGTLRGVGADTEVFVLDIGLPDMTGYELARRLRRDPRFAHAAFVALTGYGQQRDRELSKQAGFDHHLVKPVEIGKLAQILATVGRD